MNYKTQISYYYLTFKWHITIAKCCIMKLISPGGLVTKPPTLMLSEQGFVIAPPEILNLINQRSGECRKNAVVLQMRKPKLLGLLLPTQAALTSFSFEFLSLF